MFFMSGAVTLPDSSVQPDGPITIELLKKKCKINLINASCNKAIKKNKVNFVYPSKEELMLLDDESCQKTAIDKILRNITKDMANNTNTMREMILSLMTEKTYTADEMFSDVDSALYEKLDEALEEDLKVVYGEYLKKAEMLLTAIGGAQSGTSSSTSSSTSPIINPPPVTNPDNTKTYEVISCILDESYKDDSDLYPDEDNHYYKPNKSTNENLYAKWIEQIPIDPDTLTYTMPKIVVGHMDFEPEENHSNLNFRTIYNWEKQGKVLIDYKTGTVFSKETREKLGRVVEYSRGYNEQETIQELEDKEREAEEEFCKQNGINKEDTNESNSIREKRDLAEFCDSVPVQPSDH